VPVLSIFGWRDNLGQANLATYSLSSLTPDIQDLV
jgi:hypothetical protein